MRSDRSRPDVDAVDSVRVAFGAAIGIARAADTFSILVMEIVDDAIMLMVPGAMDAALASLLFWSAPAVALAVAFAAALPVSRWLIGRGRGHAVVHSHHTRGA